VKSQDTYTRKNVGGTTMRLSLAAALCVACVPYAIAADDTKALSDTDCDVLWKQAGGKPLTAETAKPYVTKFEQVDIDKDGSIDYREFKDACKAGLVKKPS
jgi:hypothetical protein